MQEEKILKMMLHCFVACFLFYDSQAYSRLLEKSWSLTNSNGSIQLNDITIPSGVYSELERTNDTKFKTESVLFSYNDIALRWIGKENWTYCHTFQVSDAERQHKFLLLTFHGLDTLTKIYVNDRQIGATINMFVRYSFDVKDLVKNETNILRIEFHSPVEAAKNLKTVEVPPECVPSSYNGECHVNLLRKMQASFGWDWALAAPSMGIWKNIFLEIYDSAIVRHMTHQLKSDNDVWTLRVFVHMETGLTKMQFNGTLSCELVDVVRASYPLQIESDEFGEFTAEIDLKVLRNLVDEWWPNGYGNQTLYDLKVDWVDSRMKNSNNLYSDSKTVTIGFRTIELIQDEMADGLSFYFKVNDVPMFMKGSNWIPSHILPERSTDEARVMELLQAARDANMNMLRVWGGGMYESSLFYSLADKYGILIWQDMMFACSMYPSNEDFLISVRQEVKEQVRRLQHHPSIALFATNNENEAALRSNWYGTSASFEQFAEDYRKLYADTVSDEIRKNDPSREILMSSPSNGDYNDDRQFGIGRFPQNPLYGDIHFYTVTDNAWKPETFPRPRFSSEYGFQSLPSGWSVVLRNGDNLSHLINHRQHHPQKNSVISFSIDENLKIDFESLDWFDKIYLSQLTQAIAVKTETEVYRSGRGTSANTMGSLYWQLNDVWVAPSWSSIEYNGNYKILHHWIREIFAPQAIIVQMSQSDKLQIFVVSDEINVEAKAVTITMNLHRCDDFQLLSTTAWSHKMKSNAVSLHQEYDIYEFLFNNSFSIGDVIAEFHLTENSDGRVLSKSYLIPGEYATLGPIYDPKPRLNIVNSNCTADGHHTLLLGIEIQKPALFLSIDFVHDTIKRYRLSDNGFIQLESMRIIKVTFTNPLCAATVTVNDFKTHCLNPFLPGYIHSTEADFSGGFFDILLLLSIFYFSELM